MRCYACVEDGCSKAYPSPPFTVPPYPLQPHWEPLADSLGYCPLDPTPYRLGSNLCSKCSAIGNSEPCDPYRTRGASTTRTAKTAFVDNQLFPGSVRFSRLALPRPTLLPQGPVRASKHLCPSPWRGLHRLASGLRPPHCAFEKSVKPCGGHNLSARDPSSTAAPLAARLRTIDFPRSLTVLVHYRKDPPHEGNGRRASHVRASLPLLLPTTGFAHHYYRFLG